MIPARDDRIARDVNRVGQFDFRFDGRDELDQDHEWCDVRVEGEWRRIRFHDYHEVFNIPGLYEALFYRQLKCCSPNRVIGLLNEVLSDFPQTGEDLRALDIGAGNGMVGYELRCIGASRVIGIDILPEAKEATERDRPGIYDDYLVTDISGPEPEEVRAIQQLRPNCLTVVAALGFGDIPKDAFIAAYNMIETPGWLAFNIKEDFLDESTDETGFSGLIRGLNRKGLLQIQAYRRYRHRLSIQGDPLHYVALVATKKEPIPEGWMSGN